MLFLWRTPVAPNEIVILDVPLPMRFVCQSYRCRTCESARQTTDSDDELLLRPRSSTDSDYELLLRSRSSTDSDDDRPLGHYLAQLDVQPCVPPTYRAVSDDDVRQAFPGALVCRPPRCKAVWMTPLFVLELCQAFYENLRARQLRLHIAPLYSSDALAEQLRLAHDGLAPYSFTWALAAIPDNDYPPCRPTWVCTRFGHASSTASIQWAAASPRW